MRIFVSSSSGRGKPTEINEVWEEIAQPFFPCRRRINRITIVVFSGRIEAKICYWRTTRYELGRKETRERVTNKTTRRRVVFFREEEEEEKKLCAGKERGVKMIFVTDRCSICICTLRLRRDKRWSANLPYIERRATIDLYTYMSRCLLMF